MTQTAENKALKKSHVSPWGTFKVAPGESGCWRLGPCSIWIRRNPREWYVAVDSRGEYLSTASEVRLPIEDQWPDSDQATFARFAFSETSDTISLWPELSPRSVVFSPETPVFVTSGEHVILYVSTPLWARIETGEPPMILGEYPTYRPSDTWFGPNWQEGEHCYSVKMLGRLELNAVTPRIHRAITPIKIRNRANDVLPVEHVRLPVQYLSLYKATDGMLWTQPVVLERGEDGADTVLRLTERFETDMGDMRLVSPPREEHATGFVVRAWHWFFQKMKEA